MAEIQLAMGAVADIASGDELKNSHDSLVDTIKQNSYKPPRKGISRPLAGTVTSAGGTTFANADIIEVIPDRPAEGRCWSINVLNVADLESLGTSEATVIVYWVMGDPSNPTAATILWSEIGLPASKSFSDMTIVMKPEQALFAMVLGATSGHELMANVVVTDYVTTEIESRGI